jgi:soluble lytic murein transglycosylase-like protein
MSNGSIDLDKVFCMVSKKYGLEKLLLKAIATVESSMNPLAYRYEEEFWKNYKHKFPELADRDPKEVSASYGLMQIMYTTAWNLGFRGPGTDLYQVVYNVELAGKLLVQLREQLVPKPFWRCWPTEVMLARYNGGSWKNPGDEGNLRNWDYVLRVKREYINLWTKEKNCD